MPGVTADSYIIDIWYRISDLPVLISHLQEQIDDDTIDVTCVAESIDMRIKDCKETYVLTIHNSNIYEQQRKRNTTKERYTLWITKINGKQITAKTYESLIDKLYLHYQGQQRYIVSNLFAEWIRSRSERKKVSAKSLMEYRRIWDSYYSNSIIADKDITKITDLEWRELFLSFRDKNGELLTKKQFNQAKIVINGIITYCRNHNILAINPISNIDFNSDDYYLEESGYNQVKCKPFNSNQVGQIIAWCQSQLMRPKVSKIYYLAIMFNIGIGLRFAELCGLRWSDIDLENHMILVSGQSTLHYEMNDDLTFTDYGRQRIDRLKSNESARAIALTNFEEEILLQTRSLHLSEEFVFPMRYHTYNQNIKDGAKAIGLNPDEFRTHCLRSTAATNLYSICHDEKAVQQMLGHTTATMTQKYILNSMSVEAIRKARETAMHDIHLLA